MLRKFVSKMYIYILTIFIVGILIAICFFSAGSTTYLIDWERTTYVKDSFFLNLVVALVLIVFLVMIRKSRIYKWIVKKIDNEYQFKKVKRIMLFIIFLIGAIWALSTQFVPGVDEGEIQTYAYLATKGNFDVFAPGQYMNRYPCQWGLFLFDYILSILFGSLNYLVFELINAIAISVIFNQLCEIGKINGMGKIGQLILLLVGIIFFPITFYSIMVYGNMLGVALSLTAIKYEIIFMEKKKRRDALRCAIFISLAILIKSTMLIYFLAILFSVIIKLIIEPSKRVVLFIMLLGIGYVVQANGIRTTVEYMSGYEMTEPCSNWAFVAMGLQEGDLAPGWWNGYVISSYEEGNVNTNEQTKISKEAINSAIVKFKNDHDYAKEFFLKKFTSTWVNPTFQCFATVRNGEYVIIPEWVRKILTYNGQFYVVKYLNIISYLIYFGTLIDSIFLFKRKEFNKFILPMAFVGGVVFLSFWETKARYALMFFIAIIPSAVEGYLLLIRKIGDLEEKRKQIFKWKEFFIQVKSVYVPIVTVILALCFCASLYNTKYCNILNEDTPQYIKYLQSEDTNCEIINYIGENKI